MIRVQAEPFDSGAEINRLIAGHGEAGGLATFIGLVRGEGGRVATLRLDHYPGMAERQLAAIEAEARRRWRLVEVSLIHRFGRLAVGEGIVFVAVLAAHRGDALAACAFLIDRLKTQVPFWKHEAGPAGGDWVVARPEDQARSAAWDEDPSALTPSSEGGM
jgi:molybdopterin synthase catalytic subunit